MQKYKNPELVTVRAKLCAKTEYKSKSTNIKIENLRVWEVFARSKSRNCSICLRLRFPLESLHEKNLGVYETGRDILSFWNTQLKMRKTNTKIKIQL